MSNQSDLSSLPHPNVEYLSHPGHITEAVIRGMISNPVYAGIPPYSRVVSDEVWIKSAIELIEEEGVEQFLVNMLYMLRASMVDAIPDEAIPEDYDGPWPAQVEPEADELEGIADSSFGPPLPWPELEEEDLIFCSHDGLPMIDIEDEFVCVSEYLYAHLDGTPVIDLVTEPELALVFQNGHTLPLLCPDCGQSLHIGDLDGLLETLTGMVIIDVDWNSVENALVIEFGLPSATGDVQTGEILFVHLNSVQALTCPQSKTWHAEGGDEEEEGFFGQF